MLPKSQDSSVVQALSPSEFALPIINSHKQDINVIDKQDINVIDKQDISDTAGSSKHSYNHKRNSAMLAYLKSNGSLSKAQIAKTFGVSSRTVSRWASEDGWESILAIVSEQALEESADNIPCPKVDYTACCNMLEFLPKETAGIIEMLTTAEPVDILWQNITLQYATIIRAQKLMDIESEKILRLEKRTAEGLDSSITEWENHTPWERYRLFMDIQNKSMNALTAMLKHLDTLKQQGLINAQLSSKIALIKAQSEKLCTVANEDEPVINVISDVERAQEEE